MGHQVATFGIRADAPETAYGYIEFEGNRVVRFVEKPSLVKARARQRSEHWVVVSGTARVVNGENELDIVHSRFAVAGQEILVSLPQPGIQRDAG